MNGTTRRGPSDWADALNALGGAECGAWTMGPVGRIYCAQHPLMHGPSHRTAEGYMFKDERLRDDDNT